MTTSVTHLIVVCCHGIWLGGPSKGYDESEWLIAGFQKGETPTFVEHVRAGVEALARQEAGSSVLCFSGGPTRRETPLSEAQSYADLAAANDYFDHSTIKSSPVPILIEDRALDSYHNVLFSLTLFFKTFQTWPSHLTIISHGFKKERLIDHHCNAIGVKLNAVSFIGIDPPDLDEGDEGIGRAVEEWREDPHGKGEKLRGKRRKRNPWGKWQGVFDNAESTNFDGGLVTIGQGEEQTLVDGAVRPW